MCHRALIFERSYREVASEKVDVMKELRECRRKLARVNHKLESFDSREDNLRDLRRQLSESEENAETRIDSISKEAAAIKHLKECAEKR